MGNDKLSSTHGGVTIPWVTYTCSTCKGQERGKLYPLPLNWVKLDIEIGVRSTYDPSEFTAKKETKLLCPNCSGQYTGRPLQQKQLPSSTSNQQMAAGPMRMLPPAKTTK